MRRVSFSIILFTFFISKVSLSQSNSYSSCLEKISSQDCIKLLARNSDLWKKDSLASSGFRRLLGEEFLSRCGDSLVGVKWSDIAIYLGKPHYSGISDDKHVSYGKGEVFYRYVLFTYGQYQDWTVPGTLILHIKVFNGIVREFWVQEMDG